MQRILSFVLLLLAAGTGRPAAAQAGADGLLPRPTPFRFVNDQASLMAPADAKKLEGGLRRYADNTGTQVVVVTVPTLGGREVADYARALGTAWGVGQRDKNNGVVVLLSGQEHKVTIQPGSGLASVITPAVTQQVISQMTPNFKQGNYFAGLRTGLNTLMTKANPGSAPQKTAAGTASEQATGGAVAGNITGADAATPSAMAPEPVQQTSEPVTQSPAPAPEPASPGFGMGALLLGAVVIGGGLWFLLRMFRNRSTAGPAASYPNNRPNNAPDFLPNRTTGPAGGYGPGQAPGNYGGMPNQSGGGMGVGGMLATGAAAAAGAYLGNRMASGHDTGSNGLNPDGAAPHHYDAGAAGAGAAGNDYFASRDGAAEAPAPDYFSDDNAAAGDSSSDYFSSNDNSSSYDDTSSGDSGGGGFDSGSDNSGSW